MRLILTVCAVVATTASAGGEASASGGSERVRTAIPAQTTQSPKLASNLSELARAERQGGMGAARARAMGLEVEGGRVRVVVESARNDQAARAAVSAAGGEVEAAYEGLLQAMLPFAALEEIARESAVEYVRAPRLALEQAITGEEVALSNVNVFQAAKWTGAGVKVGVVDVGFTGLAARQAAGELPAVTGVDFCNGGFDSAHVHGTAVAEIIHE